MRHKKNREVNIFSASVVDLFASGMGVFLIVSIIAMANQNKEKVKTIESPDSAPMISELKNKIENLNQKVEEITKENYQLKTHTLAVKKVQENSKNTDHIAQVEVESLKMNFVRSTLTLENKIKKLESQLAKSKSTTITNTTTDNTPDTFTNEYEIGKKIRLEDVQFYPGTDRMIEPFASREIKSFAQYMINNEQVTVEVSGHIFETKKAIESGEAEDVYFLSGRRARAVCGKLVEFGVSDKRFNCVGYGATRALFLTNDQYSEQAQKNRRVEIEILKK